MHGATRQGSATDHEAQYDCRCCCGPCVCPGNRAVSYVLLNALAMYLYVLLLCQFVFWRERRIRLQEWRQIAKILPSKRHKSIVQPRPAPEPALISSTVFGAAQPMGKSKRAKDEQQFVVAVSTPSIMRRPAASLTV